MQLLCFSFPLHILFFLFIFSFFFSSTYSFHDDRQSLLAFKNEITTDPHGSMAADWSLAVPFCNWTAVTCSRRHMNRVVSLDLSDMELHGSISPYLGNLTFLHSLNLSNNALHGHIPTQLGRLFRLRELRLHRNQLEGNIPSDLGNCTNLAYLALLYNNLTGSIPEKLGSLTHLQVSVFLRSKQPHRIAGKSTALRAELFTISIEGRGTSCHCKSLQRTYFDHLLIALKTEAIAEALES